MRAFRVCVVGLTLFAWLVGAACGATVTYRKQVLGAKTLVTPVVRGVSAEVGEVVNEALAALVEDEVMALADVEEPRQLIVQGKAELKRGALLSFSFTGMVDFEGAAHPSSSRRGITFDSRTGDEILLEDLFLPGAGWRDAVNWLVSCEIDRQVEDEGLMVFDDEEYPDVLEYSDQFFLRPGELVLFWTDTQFTPHASGQPEFALPIGDLEQYLRPEYSSW